MSPQIMLPSVVDFHDYFVMAPLKQWSLQVCLLIEGIHFHDYFVMAPLKLTHIDANNGGHWGLPWLFCHGPIEASPAMAMSSKASHFHDYFVMAPLKRISYFPHLMPAWLLPWLFCHGPIEAIMRGIGQAKRQILPWLFCHGPIEAMILACSGCIHKSTSMTILSWPHWSWKKIWNQGEPRDFHDYFVMAPLKHHDHQSCDGSYQTSMTILSWPH